MPGIRKVYLTVMFLCFAAASAVAVEPGKASGTMTFDSTTTALAFASATSQENLFDSSKQDTIIVLTDKALGDITADDDIGLTQKAERGELAVLTVRLDGNKLVNVRVNHKGLQGTQILPAGWFQFTSTGKMSGTLKLAKRDTDGHSYACSVEFAGSPVKKETKVEPSAPAPSPKPAPEPKLAPATTSNIDPKTLTAMLVKAMMDKDEHMAVELIKQGADPNAKDQYGTPMLNWAVMMCQPKVVQALVDKKADVKVERVPGFTIMQEAGACPEAAKILKAAGAK